MYILTWHNSPGNVGEYMADSWEDASCKMYELVCKGFQVTVRYA